MDARHIRPRDVLERTIPLIQEELFGMRAGGPADSREAGRRSRREGGRNGAARPRGGGGEDSQAVRQAAALVATTRSWVEQGSSVGEAAVRAMEALCRVGRREIQGDAVNAVRAMIAEGCSAIAAPDAASCRTPTEVLWFLRAVQRMLYQESLKMEDAARRHSVDTLLTLLTATHSAVQMLGQAPAPDSTGASYLDLQLLLELSRTVGCFLYEAPTVSAEILPRLITVLRPLLEFPRDMPTTNSAVVAATLLQRQQQQQPQQLHSRHTRALLSACSADALANATAGLGRATDSYAIDVFPQLVINLHAWSSLVTASLSLESIATDTQENAANIDVYMEALAGTLRALQMLLCEVAASSASATSMANALSDLTVSELRGGRLLPALAECLVNITLWVPSKSAVVAAQAQGNLQGMSDSEISAAGASSSESGQSSGGGGRQGGVFRRRGGAGAGGRED